MAPTNSVVCAVKVPSEIVEALAFDQIHTLSVETLYRSVYYWLIWELVRKAESLTPVTEVARYDEDSPLVHEKRKKYLCVENIFFFCYIPNHQRY